MIQEHRGRCCGQVRSHSKHEVLKVLKNVISELGVNELDLPMSGRREFQLGGTTSDSKTEHT
jgi:hypothetical protein